MCSPSPFKNYTWCWYFTLLLFWPILLVVWLCLSFPRTMFVFYFSTFITSFFPTYLEFNSVAYLLFAKVESRSLVLYLSFSCFMFYSCCPLLILVRNRLSFEPLFSCMCVFLSHWLLLRFDSLYLISSLTMICLGLFVCRAGVHSYVLFMCFILLGFASLDLCFDVSSVFRSPWSLCLQTFFSCLIFLLFLRL